MDLLLGFGLGLEFRVRVMVRVLVVRVMVRDRDRNKICFLTWFFHCCMKTNPGLPRQRGSRDQNPGLSSLFLFLMKREGT